MEELKQFLTDMGCRIEKGIGSDKEIFVYDAENNSVACVLVGDQLSVVSNRDIETQDGPEYFTANISSRSEVLQAVSNAFIKEIALK